MATAIEKPLAVSEHANHKDNDKETFFKCIEIYLNTEDDVVSAKMLRFLDDIDAHLRNAVSTSADKNQESDNIDKALKIMQKNFNRIEKQQHSYIVQ